LGGSPGRRMTEPLVGRDGELEFLRSFVDQAAVAGGALLVWGDAGVGKTVLLDAAASLAKAAGTRVLRARGAEFEAEVSFAGLNQVLYPLFDGLPRLTAAHRRALSVALGLREGRRPDQLVVSNAALSLLRHAGADGPLLLIVDDLPWVDRASAAVLGFVARRVTGSQVGFLAAARSSEESFFERGGLPGYELQPLDEAAAEALIGDRFPALVARVRRRLLSEAQGNPLALLELPVALSGQQRGALRTLPAILPLSRRLQAVFAARVRPLPARTRRLLLIAALDDRGDLRVLGAGGSAQRGIDELAPAERAQLIHVDEGTGRLEFRHPLIRSAVVELSTSDERRRVHQVLAKRHADQPQRRAWHLAEAAVGPDEQVAVLLQDAALAGLRRGDSVGAVSGLLRAGELSPPGSRRSGRLAEAARIGATLTGDLREVPQLLAAARKDDPEGGGSLSAAEAGAYYLVLTHGDIDGARRLLAGAIESLPDRRDAHNESLIAALYTLNMLCYQAGRAEVWESLHTALGRLEPHPPELLTILYRALSGAVEDAAPMLDQLDSAIAALSSQSSPTHIVRTSYAAVYLDRLAGCREALWRVVIDGRHGGAITHAIEALILLSNDGYMTGQWDEVIQLTDEALALCQTHGYRAALAPARFYRSLVAAARGDEDTTRSLTDEMMRWAVPRRLRTVEVYAHTASALAALGRADFESAYQSVTAVSPAGMLAPYVPHARWLVMDLVEAAVRTGRRADANNHVAVVRRAGLAALSSRLGLLVAAAAAIVAPSGRDRDLFQDALATPGASTWPFDLARVQLAYGERLRRTKATTEAREHLAAALDVFERLGAKPWATRAGNELRATGLTIGHAHVTGTAALTPQQREIAGLAATGLTNRQISERMFLSPRTIANHLYQIFPKLGITSRAALRDALTTTPTEQSESGDQERVP